MGHQQSTPVSTVFTEGSVQVGPFLNLLPTAIDLMNPNLRKSSENIPKLLQTLKLRSDTHLRVDTTTTASSQLDQGEHLSKRSLSNVRQFRVMAACSSVMALG